MASKIRHVAIFAQDTAELANFYTTTFGMKEVHRGQVNNGVQAIYISDGYINLAILPANGKQEGITHFGFQVDSVEETGSIAAAAGAKDRPTARPRDGRFAEFRIHDPVGIPVDLAEKGWKT